MDCQDYYNALDEDIAAAQEEVASAERRLAQAQSWLAELQAQVPPFKPGQQVRVAKTASLLTVQGCERAFGEWVVKGTFPSSNYKTYYYPASALVAEDDDDLPF